MKQGGSLTVTSALALLDVPAPESRAVAAARTILRTADPSTRLEVSSVDRVAALTIARRRLARNSEVLGAAELVAELARLSDAE